MLNIIITLLFAFTLNSMAADWAQWRGPNRDGVNPEKGLANQWPKDGPKLIYKATGVGIGFSSVVISGDTLYTLGDLDDACYLFALDLKGNHKWKSRVGEPKGHRGYPGPRSTPTVANNHVYALGQQGDLVCVSTSGKEIWRADIQNSYEGRMMSGWRWSESPLVDDGKVIVTPGGPKGAVLALDTKTGKQVWRCSDFTDSAGYSSIIIREIGNIKQYIQLTGKSVAGINAINGKLLWKANRSGKTAVISTPIYDKGTLFVTSAYGVGCNGFNVEYKNGKFEAKEIYKHVGSAGMANHHGGAIRVGDYVYGSNGGQLSCLRLADGKVMWNERSAGKGAIIVVGNKIILRTEKGPISLIKLDPERYEEISRFNQPERSRAKAWAHPVVLDGRLYLRDQDNLFVYDIKG